MLLPLTTPFDAGPLPGFPPKIFATKNYLAVFSYQSKGQVSRVAGF
jgi:hypothetical protein